MDLPNLLQKFKSSSAPAHRFVAIEISTYAVKSAIWQVQANQTQIISTGSVQSWDTQSEDDLLSALDLSLADAYAGTEGDPNEVIFGLPETWVSHETIAQPKKPLIKTICQKLNLKPVGFVVTTEAIVHYLKDTEGGPTSGILINIAPEEIAVSLINLGIVDGTQVVGRSQQIYSDVEEAIARFPKAESLPSRMILYDAQEDLEAIKQELINFDWQAKLPFLHIPKIESLKKDISIQAVALSGGAEVAQALGLTQESEVSKKPKASQSPGPVQDSQITPIAQEEITRPPITPPPVPPSPKDTESPNVSERQDSDSFGFTTQTVDDIDAASTTSPNTIILAPSLKDEPLPDSQVPPEIKPKKPFTFPKFKFPRFTLPKLSFSKKNLPAATVSIIVILVILIVAGLWAYWNVPHATVTLLLNQKPIIKDVNFTLDPQAQQTDVFKKVIAGVQDTVTVSGSKTMATTGTKTIGEPATGKIALYNRTLSQKTFAKGTALTANGKNYYIDDAVTIASASAQENNDFSITVQPSKVEVGITSAGIGESYNLPANTELTVESFGTDSFIGSTTTTIGGGYSEQVQVVDADDLTTIKAALLDQLQSQQVETVKQKSNGTQGVIPTDDVNVSQEEYSAKVGEQTNNLTLEITLEQPLYVYSLDDVALIAEALAQGEIPSGYTVNAKDTNVEVVETTVNEDGTASITASISLMLMPQLKEMDIARTITGKFPDTTKDYFAGLPGYSKVEIGINPVLPKAIATFPRVTDHIEIIIKPAN